jgi:uncharacterized protein (DUF362 family)
MTSVVSIIKVPKSARDFTPYIEKAVTLIGPFCIPPYSRVLIKPNLCTDKSAESGATTDPKLVEGIICFLRKAASPCEIAIVESNTAVADADELFELLGYTTLAEKYDVPLINLSDDKQHKLTLDDGAILSTITVPETLLFSDFLISVPKLKTMCDQKITCALKNQFGLLPKKHRATYHPFLAEMLVDINRLYLPDLFIVDGIVAMEGFGPSEGNPKHTGLIICGNDAVAVDATVSRIMGFNPEKVPHVNYAYKKGLGQIKGIQLVGDKINVDQFKFIPRKAYFMSRMALRIQRLGTYFNNFGDLILKGRGIMSTVGASFVFGKLSLSKTISTIVENLSKLEA